MQRPQDAPPADDAASDAACWGIPQPQATKEDDAAVWEENVPALLAYLEVSTQWRIVSLAEGGLHAVGLDYQGVKVGLELAGTEITPALWSDLQMVEIGARAAMNGEKE